MKNAECRIFSLDFGDDEAVTPKQNIGYFLHKVQAGNDFGWTS